MKKIFSVLIMALVSMTLAFSPFEALALSNHDNCSASNSIASIATTYVYVNSGQTTYHKASCKLLKKGCKKITLKTAKAKCYVRCTVCKPAKY